MSLSPTERFSDRVENYVKYRPRYPEAIIPYLASEAGLLASHVVADIGSGTGFLTELFLHNGNHRVYGVEPNTNMREAGERLLAAYPAFISRNATAENTGLAAASIDFVVAGQAFHWFEAVAARREFQRILKPDGRIVLIWNDRRENDPFANEYENLLQNFGTDYASVSVKYRGGHEEVAAFFSGNEFRKNVFENSQTLDYPSLQGRLLSASYAPQPGNAGYEPMIDALKGIFRRHAKDGVVRMAYETHIYWGAVGNDLTQNGSGDQDHSLPLKPR